jgi:hypothetical protein
VIWNSILHTRHVKIKPGGFSSHWLMCVEECRAPREPVARGVFEGVDGTVCSLRMYDDFVWTSGVRVSVRLFDS